MIANWCLTIPPLPPPPLPPQTFSYKRPMQIGMLMMFFSAYVVFRGDNRGQA